MERNLEEENLLLNLEGIKKNFGGLRALDNVDFKLRYGETVALLGDNGAGKSTLIKIITGVHVPDNGNIYIRGEKINKLNPKLARENYGVETVFQDLALFSLLDITSNLFIGKEIRRGPFLRPRYMNRLAKEALDKTGIQLGSDLRQQIGWLSGGQQHAVAICRAVYSSDVNKNYKKILLLDEPTAGLGVKETDLLLDLINDLKKQEQALIFITHTLEHAFRVADRFVVLRSGKKVGERLAGETDSKELIHMMVG